MRAIRDAFRERRIQRGLTQEDVAQSASLTRKTVSDFENGKASITAANLSRLLVSVGLELAVREASARPTLDDLAERYTGEESSPSPARRRARGRKR